MTLSYFPFCFYVFFKIISSKIKSKNKSSAREALKAEEEGGRGGTSVHSAHSTKRATPKMASKDFTFHEAMKDSPNFRFELGQHERYFDRMQKRLEDTIRSMETVIEQGQNMVASFYTFTVSLNRLWLDLQLDDARDKSAVETFKQLSDSLAQILNLNRSLVDHAYPTLKAGFETYLKRELGKLGEVKAHFNSLSSSLHESLGKKAAIGKNKAQELHDAENALTAIGTCFSHTGLDYVAQINIAHALKCPHLLEALWVFVKEYGNFFTRGNQLFAEQQQEFVVGDEITRMRTQYKQIERKMQDRHTFVPKEIFQHPSGIPIDPQCIMEGYLFKRATNAFKTWNRRWFMIKDGKLLYSHKTSDGEPEVPTVMEDNLKLCLVRPAPASIDRACCFELVTPTKNHFLQADSESLCNAWIRALQRTIQNLHEDDHGSYAQSRKSFIGGIEPTSSISESDFPLLNGQVQQQENCRQSQSSAGEDISTSHPQHSQIKDQRSDSHLSCASSSAETATSMSPLARQQQVSERAKQHMKLFLQELLAVPGNDRCADCGCPDAKWTSLNLGVIICIECSGVHRSLGVHFSKVRSLTMDTLEAEHRNILLQLGNRKVNAIFLRNLPEADENAKMGISRHTNRDSREQWIIAKYVEKKFVLLPPIQPLAYSRSVSALNGSSSSAPLKDGNRNDATSSNSIKLRDTKIVKNLNLIPPNANNCASNDLPKMDIFSENCRMSRCSSFGSDSNLMQSAKAAIVQRTSAASIAGKCASRLDALRNGCLAEVLRSVVQDGFDLNECLNVENGGPDKSTLETPLHIAVENHQTTLVEFLLLNGAKINALDGTKNTALHLAAELGHTIIVYQLLKRNAEKTLQNAEGKTALELAVEKCHADIVTLLRLHDMKEEFNDDQNSTMDETVESFIGDLAAKQQEMGRKGSHTPRSRKDDEPQDGDDGAKGKK